MANLNFTRRARFRRLAAIDKAIAKAMMGAAELLGPAEVLKRRVQDVERDIVAINSNPKATEVDRAVLRQRRDELERQARRLIDRRIRVAERKLKHLIARRKTAASQLGFPEAETAQVPFLLRETEK